MSIKYKYYLLGLLLWLITMTVNALGVNNLFHYPQDPVLGNPHGKVTVVEFFDYQCSHCVDMVPVMNAVMRANPNVRFVFKEYPIRGSMSFLAAKAALAANKQGKYQSFNHALFQSGSLSQESIYDIAAKTGLNMAKFKRDVQSKSVLAQINNNVNLARNLNVTGTPAFFIGKSNASDINQVTFVLGTMSQSQLQDAINRS